MFEAVAVFAGILLVLTPIVGFVTLQRLIAARERQVLAQYESRKREE